MIINKNKKNNIILTLSERIQEDGSFYLFYLKSKFNNTEERVFLSDNISTHRIRYDEFEITEKDNPDYLNNEVDLFTGQWQYTIFETDNQNLDINDTIKILQKGMLIVTSDKYN